jgi:hypothetical protein
MNHKAPFAGRFFYARRLTVTQAPSGALLEQPPGKTKLVSPKAEVWESRCIDKPKKQNYPVTGS